MLIRTVLLSLALSLTTVLFWSAAAYADGTVYRANGCGKYLFVSTTEGYSLLETDGSNDGIKEGDLLTGNVDRIGEPLLFDSTAGRSVFGQVIELRMTPAEVAQRIGIRCRAALGDTIVSGYVLRANGCGTRIFVDAPQGIAVLQRIAGGTVADGDTLMGSFNHPGRTTVQDRQTGSTLVAFVEDLWLSKSAADRKMTTSCRR
ncbi:MAG TPA: hypothetical protein VHW90_04860 [Stellaceae bacterium]|jgi:hypothetical protein|nr:hypothetical protein [Stellaceae bacterium]